MDVTLSGVQIRMTHQFRHTEYVDTGLDGPRSISMAKVVEAEGRLDSTFPQLRSASVALRVLESREQQARS